MSELTEFTDFSIEERGAGNLVAVFQNRYPQEPESKNETESITHTTVFNESSLAERIDNLARDDRNVSLEVKAMVSLRAKKAVLGLA